LRTKYIIKKAIKLMLAVGLLAGLFSVISAAPAQANRPGEPVRLLQAEVGVPSISHVHASLLNGNKPGEPRVTLRQTHDHVASLTEGADIITLTEVNTWQRANAVRQNGWGLCWQPGDDSAVLFRKAFASKKWSASKSVTQVRYYSSLGHRWVLPPKITACLLVLKAPEVEGKRVLVTVGHAVSCAFSRWNNGWIPANQLCSNGRTTANRTYIRQNRVRPYAYKMHLKGWANWERTLASRFHPDVELTTGDLNLDAKKAWVRKYLRSVWGSRMLLGWQKWADRDYTHLMQTYHGTYRLLLDATLISGAGVSYQHTSVAFSEQVASDHSPLQDIIGLPQPAE
jgi:hypothetical protein